MGLQYRAKALGVPCELVSSELAGGGGNLLDLDFWDTASTAHGAPSQTLLTPPLAF